MLDDLSYIKERDLQDTLGIAERQWQQFGYEFPLDAWPYQGSIENIVYTGMGGSALAAVIAQTWPGFDRPFEVVRGYQLPRYIGHKTLVIAASYSGNTEETLSALEQAGAAGAQIAVIAGGGKLADAAQSHGYPLLTLPKAEQPRYAVFYNLKALLVLLRTAQVLPDAEVRFSELDRAAAYLEEIVKRWLPGVPTDQNQAKQLAQEIIGKSLVIYAGPVMGPVAYKWKISANENAKHIAWWNQFPEFNHNEFMGWTEQPVDKPYCVVDLRSSFEHPRIQKRFEVTERLLSGRRPQPEVVQLQGDTLLEQLVYGIALGDFVTLYLALLNGLNPAPVDLIEKFKKSLDD